MVGFPSFYVWIIFHCIAYSIPVVMYGCESWTIKKAEPRRMDAFELWCRRRLLKAPWTARGSIQLILKEINPEYSLEGLMLKLQYFSYLMRRADSLKRPLCWERLKAGGEEGDRGWDGWKASPIQWTWTWANSRRCWGTRWAGALLSVGSQRVNMTWQLNNSDIPFHVYITFSLSIHPLMGHLGCFHILVLLNDAAITEECKYLLKIPISILLELLAYMVVLIFNFFEETLNFFT